MRLLKAGALFSACAAAVLFLSAGGAQGQTLSFKQFKKEIALHVYARCTSVYLDRTDDWETEFPGLSRAEILSALAVIMTPADEALEETYQTVRNVSEDQRKTALYPATLRIMIANGKC
ncbi:MAG: hypothetical protein OXD36_04665 [Rhodobacter sp.]|nr:hypothetical protein [Rhodobacter sp.]